MNSKGKPIAANQKKLKKSKTTSDFNALTKEEQKTVKRKYSLLSFFSRKKPPNYKLNETDKLTSSTTLVDHPRISPITVDFTENIHNNNNESYHPSNQEILLSSQKEELDRRKLQNLQNLRKQFKSIPQIDTKASKTSYLPISYHSNRIITTTVKCQSASSSLDSEVSNNRYNNYIAKSGPLVVERDDDFSNYLSYYETTDAHHENTDDYYFDNDLSSVVYEDSDSGLFEILYSSTAYMMSGNDYDRDSISRLSSARLSGKQSRFIYNPILNISQYSSKQRQSPSLIPLKKLNFLTQTRRLNRITQPKFHSEYSIPKPSKNQKLRQKTCIRKLSNLMAALWIAGLDKDSFDPFVLELIDLKFVTVGKKRMDLLLGFIYVDEFSLREHGGGGAVGNGKKKKLDDGRLEGNELFDKMVKDLKDVWESRYKMIDERIWKND